jgi:serine/threonine protein kinase
VKLATHERTKVRVALKMYPLSKVDIGIRRKAVQSEITCMEMLENRHFPKLYTSFETTNEIVLVQEFVSGKSLFDLLKQPNNKKGLTE